MILQGTSNYWNSKPSIDGACKLFQEVQILLIWMDGNSIKRYWWNFHKKLQNICPATYKVNKFLRYTVGKVHCVEVFFWSTFSRIELKYGKI